MHTHCLKSCALPPASDRARAPARGTSRSPRCFLAVTESSQAWLTPAVGCLAYAEPCEPRPRLAPCRHCSETARHSLCDRFEHRLPLQQHTVERTHASCFSLA